MKLEEKVGELLKAKKLSLSTAESCTGGGIAALITSVPGSSEYFNGSIVAYSNEIKMSLLHVSAETLEKHGAVSRETVTEMVKGAMKKTRGGWLGHFGYRPRRGHRRLRPYRDGAQRRADAAIRGIFASVPQPWHGHSA